MAVEGLKNTHASTGNKVWRTWRSGATTALKRRCTKGVRRDKEDNIRRGVNGVKGTKGERKGSGKKRRRGSACVARLT